MAGVTFLDVAQLFVLLVLSIVYVGGAVYLAYEIKQTGEKFEDGGWTAGMFAVFFGFIIVILWTAWYQK